jgi:hypothetical protein
MLVGFEPGEALQRRPNISLAAEAYTSGVTNMKRPPAG